MWTIDCHDFGCLHISFAQNIFCSFRLYDSYDSSDLFQLYISLRWHSILCLTAFILTIRLLIFIVEYCRRVKYNKISFEILLKTGNRERTFRWNVSRYTLFLKNYATWYMFIYNSWSKTNSNFIFSFRTDTKINIRKTTETSAADDLRRGQHNKTIHKGLNIMFIQITLLVIS